MPRVKDMELIELVSVGTYIRNDGMTFPMNANGSKTIYEKEGVPICSIEPDEDWMNALSDADRATVETLWSVCQYLCRWECRACSQYP